MEGTTADGFQPVRDAFAANFTERGDTGAALAVHQDGRLVVDLWGGERCGDTGAALGTTGSAPRGEQPQPWTADTVALLRSASKGPAAAVPQLLQQRGTLDLDAPVAAYWPEFRAAGKDRVSVRQLLAHRAGVPVLDRPLSLAEAVDGVSGPRAVAAQPPVWEPGAAHGYHPHTFSWLLDELVLRVTGRTLGRWFTEELTRPLGLDLHFGPPSAVASRTARLRSVPAPAPVAGSGPRVRPKSTVTHAYRDPGSLTRRAFGAVDLARTAGPGAVVGPAAGPAAGATANTAADQPPTDENHPAYRASGLPGAAGIGTARALSAFYAMLLGPLEDGTPRLFTPGTLAAASTAESVGPDRVLVVPTRFGPGFMLHSPASPMLGPGSFGHPGRGGSLAFADPESGVGFGYVTAAMQQSVTSDPRTQAVLRALRGCLDR
ncbi:esterase [Streptomyces oceani]|uniref:Esterase n=1 Tax=Streptomyces oceani TaxID=1075402 RepID=A0A1E7KMZ8_9ACTN|nr:serine hydrolase domain-containing protein [Streptomyces oceani]OEV05254.1 esterase [Streptomyces oceani]